MSSNIWIELNVYYPIIIWLREFCDFIYHSVEPNVMHVMWRHKCMVNGLDNLYFALSSCSVKMYRDVFLIRTILMYTRRWMDSRMLVGHCWCGRSPFHRWSCANVHSTYSIVVLLFFFFLHTIFYFKICCWVSTEIIIFKWFLRSPSIKFSQILVGLEALEIGNSW